MSSTPRPHDLVWLNNAAALEAIEESWVAQHWRISLPVVVRRDVDANARIPVAYGG
ncbi:phosphoribosyl-dephospho-CoA transferase [Klebsiella michiganensis]|uniref:Phosphoribosyl-dephospho-CoA transferase n=1 Tax=Klebsiella michiganensis TaxID=1134687 RepID=A0A7H4MY74_9ENTR|nr:phosphoribosyl-dephospho-CoA transferase [Klebsiella michiganensis]